MQRFDFKWEYRPGRINVADPISRAPSLGTTSRDAAPDAEIFVCFAQMDPVSDEPGLATDKPSTVSLPPSSVSFTPVQAHATCMVVCCLRGRKRSPREEKQPELVCAATRTGKQYNDKLVLHGEQFTTHSDSMPSQVSGEVRTHTPLLWDSARGSDSNSLHEARTHSHHGDAAVFDKSVHSKCSALNPHVSVAETGTLPHTPSGVYELATDSDVTCDDSLMMQKSETFLNEVRQGYEQDKWFHSATNTGS